MFIQSIKRTGRISLASFSDLEYRTCGVVFVTFLKYILRITVLYDSYSTVMQLISSV